MICEICHGRTNLIPVCTTCGGTGVAHCCDGDRAEPIEEEFDWEALRRLRKSSGY